MTLVSAQKWESMTALVAHLESIARPSLIIGAGEESPRHFYSFSLESAVGNIELAVPSLGIGSSPSSILLDNGRRAIVGHDTWLAWIDLGVPEILKTRRLGGVFFDFIPTNKNDQVVVIHELGAIRVDSSGSEIWSVETEVIEDWRLDDLGNLSLIIMDQESETVVSIKTGQIS